MSPPAVLAARNCTSTGVHRQQHHYRTRCGQPDGGTGMSGERGPRRGVAARQRTRAPEDHHGPRRLPGPAELVRTRHTTTHRTSHRTAGAGPDTNAPPHDRCHPACDRSRRCRARHGHHLLGGATTHPHRDPIPSPVPVPTPAQHYGLRSPPGRVVMRNPASAHTCTCGPAADPHDVAYAVRHAETAALNAARAQASHATRTANRRHARRPPPTAQHWSSASRASRNG